MSSRQSSENPARNRAYWRSRRGLLELDLLLPPFVLARYDTLTPAQQRTYGALLDCDDHDVWDWLQGRGEPPDASLADVIELIRTFNDRIGRDD
jgi:antitoxin CptB